MMRFIAHVLICYNVNTISDIRAKGIILFVVDLGLSIIFGYGMVRRENILRIGLVLMLALVNH